MNGIIAEAVDAVIYDKIISNKQKANFYET